MWAVERPDRPTLWRIGYPELARYWREGDAVTTADEQYVMVGESRYYCNDSEWIVACSPPGTMILVTPKHPWRKRHRPLLAPEWQAFGDVIHDAQVEADRKPKVFELRGSWFYDGLIAECIEPDPDDLIRVRVWPSLGDVIVLAKPANAASPQDRDA